MAHNAGVNAIRATLLAVGLCLGAASAGADQNDVRLERLFEALRESRDANVARAAENSIWLAWIDHDDPAVSLLMHDGMSAMDRGDQRGALKKFEQIVNIAPDYAEGWNKRATVHYLLGNYESSLDDIDKTLALEPRHFGALSGRGLIYSALEEPALALEAFEEALEINPHMPGARHNAEALRKELEGERI